MKLTVSPDNVLETIAKWSGMAPMPLVHTNIAFIKARIIFDAVHLGIFEALKGEKKSLPEIAAACNLNATALRSMLGALTSADYLTYANEKFGLAPQAKKWLLKDAKQSLYYQMLFSEIMWDFMGGLREFMKTGRGLQYHDTFTAAQWDSYQKGMYAIARVTSPEVGQRTPLPKGATKMLDIGGSHGLYSEELCRRHPLLHSTILDLPAAVEKAKPILASSPVKDKIHYLPGDALQDDLGNNQYDLVFMANLVHHFTHEQNVALCKKIYKALKPGGHIIIQEFIRPETPTSADQVGSVLDVFFALTSTSGTWAVNEISRWQKEAGFKPKKQIKFIAIPGAAQVVAVKPI
ncbi:class I SAM-dependent methyltransferase [Rhodocytophaga aerolata]|uniref:Class I SAM-dependent methyltransferase n=1 Tax=Rhodocytophaga aerolata TaxID=455078 RepID=A0ABT8R5P2_9BACT|nr:class I SAM-dependent methyltransferase [Rhodocytophaga aerolata]MDO1447397.1 class I SAM-dependent methyltransferase [Rhodocytophaga aerolata]